MKGVIIHTGKIDPDYKEELKLMVSISNPWSFSQDQMPTHTGKVPLLALTGAYHEVIKFKRNKP
jgi:hypothetical protein